eukprot:8961424-Pyramimonas_sp.AAC.1
MQEHRFVGLKDGYTRCMRCGKGAKGQKVRANTQSPSCVPTEFGRFKCQAQIDYVGMAEIPTRRFEAVTHAMLGADRVPGE